MNIIPHMSKGGRYTSGALVEKKFLELLELAYVTYFTEKERKMEKVATCILQTNVLKFIVSVVWEASLISNKQYEVVAIKLEEVGKMFGGWKKSLENPEKKNRTL